MKIKYLIPALMMVVASNSTWAAGCNAPPLELKKNQWKQISLPCKPGENADEETINKVRDIFGKTMDGGSMGTYDKDWVIFRYSEGKHVKLKEGSPLRQGKGYWIIQISSETVRVSMPDSAKKTPLGACGFKINCFDTKALNTVPGGVGWTMLGNPLAHQFDVSQLFVQTNEPALEAPCGNGMPGIGCLLSKSLEQKIVHGQIFRYNSEKKGYDLLPSGSTELSPWDGFWAATLDQADTKDPKLRFTVPQGL